MRRSWRQASGSSRIRAISTCAPRSSARGRVSDPALLLDYLHNTGTVFYRKGLFGDQLILDQGWALDAVYGVFDRASQTFETIQRNRGRFRRSELAKWVWQKHSVPEQELFLNFMQQCGICFTIQEEDRKKRVDAEYIAPDLLPARSDDETQKRLKLVWDEASPDAEAVLTFALLPPGLVRALIAKIGSDAGFAAEYWRDGVCFYDERTASRALIEHLGRQTRTIPIVFVGAGDCCALTRHMTEMPVSFYHRASSAG